jgi:hypothetical protein
VSLEFCSYREKENRTPRRKSLASLPTFQVGQVANLPVPALSSGLPPFVGQIPFNPQHYASHRSSMKLIGYWMANLHDSHLPLPQELVGETPASVQDTVCRYLTYGNLFATYRGLSWCRFYCGAEGSEMGHREFTDGEWVWPECLVHYVREHSVLLPDEFVASASSGSVASVLGDDHSATLDFWIEWARRRQSLCIRQRLADALAAARAAEPRVIESSIQEVLREHTEGSEKCVFAGCSRRALAGRRICAFHTMTDQDLRSRAAHLYRLPRQI